MDSKKTNRGRETTNLMRKQKLLTKALAASMAVFMSVSQLSVPAFAAESKSVSIAENTYTYSTEALEGYTQIENSGLYYKLIDGSGLSGTLYGKSKLTYKEFYSGDVSSTDSFDVVTTASTSKYSVLSNAWTDYEKESAEAAGGYHVKGVANVNVAVDSDLYIESAILKDANKELSKAYEEASDITLNENPTQAPSQYKTLQKDGSYVSNSNTIVTVTDASATLATASTWGEYKISVTEKSTKYLRTTRSDEGFSINSTIQGIILETTDGYKVGLEHLANIWVQPYKLSFNVNNEAGTTGIAKSDNTAEFKKLVNKTINKITYVTPEGNYVYTFADGIFVKPAYSEEISGTFSNDMKSFTLNQIPTVKNGTLTVTYTVGAGRQKVPYTLYSGSIQKNVPLDLSTVPADAEGGSYSVDISSDDYADISVAIPVTDQQKSQLQELIKQAETALKGAGADDSVLLAHKNEAAELLANESSTSADAADLINELTELLKPYQSTEAPTPSIPDSTTASKPNTTTAAKPATKPATTAKKPNTTATKVKLAKQTTKVKANGKKKIKVSWKKDKKASGYEITYSTKKSFKGKKTIVVKSNKTTSKVVKKLTSKKKYFVKVRSYKQVGKTKTYGAYSKVKTVKVK